MRKYPQGKMEEIRNVLKHRIHQYKREKSYICIREILKILIQKEKVFGEIRGRDSWVGIERCLRLKN